MTIGKISGVGDGADMPKKTARTEEVATGSKPLIDTRHQATPNMLNLLLTEVAAENNKPAADLINKTKEKANQYKVHFINNDAPLSAIANNLYGASFDRAPIKLSVSGYTKPPYAGYADTATKLLKAINTQLQSTKLSEDKKLALITSASPDEGSIDVATMRAAFEEGMPIALLASARYVRYYGVPKEFTGKDELEQQYTDTPKIGILGKEKYTEATAELSNSHLIYGGRMQSVRDAVNSALKGEKVVVVLDEKDANLDDINFEEKTQEGKTETHLTQGNASAYLAHMIENTEKGNSTDSNLKIVGGLDRILGKKNLMDNIQIIRIKDDSDMDDLAKRVISRIRPDLISLSV